MVFEFVVINILQYNGNIHLQFSVYAVENLWRIINQIMTPRNGKFLSSSVLSLKWVKRGKKKSISRPVHCNCQHCVILSCNET